MLFLWKKNQPSIVMKHNRDIKIFYRKATYGASCIIKSSDEILKQGRNRDYGVLSDSPLTLKIGNSK